MNTANRLDALVQALVHARHEHVRLEAASWQDALSDAGEAYDVQARLAAALNWFDTRFPTYWKSGGTSPSFGSTHAALPPPGVRKSPADFGDMSFDAVGIEAEIALRLGRDVTPAQAAQTTLESAQAYVDAAAVAIELLDSRWQEGRGAAALLRLADLQSHGALVLGEWMPYDEAHDWKAQRCEVHIAGQDVVAHTGSLPSGHPASVLPAWLRHATRHGATVPAGTIVATGSWSGILPGVSGDHVTVRFPGIGEIEARL